MAASWINSIGMPEYERMGVSFMAGLLEFATKISKRYQNAILMNKETDLLINKILRANPQ